jgi:hypothetical protein
MDSSKLIEKRRMAANVYLSRGQPQDAGMVTYRNQKIGAYGGDQFRAPYSTSEQLNANCCPPTAKDNHGAASDYGDSRLDTSSQAGATVNSSLYIQEWKAGAAICCNNTPATTPPQGIYYSTCCYLEREPNPVKGVAAYTNGCGYNQTPHAVTTCTTTNTGLDMIGYPTIYTAHTAAANTQCGRGT